MTTAYQTLSSLVQGQATGEFICAGDDVEIHVFLQAGRLAWATLSTKPMEFVQYLQRNCAVDMDLFREALAHASKTRAPVGETLVAWKLVSRDDVRKGILHQMTQALAALKSLGPSQTMFLERKHFSTYDASFTFTLSEVVSAAEPALVPPTPAKNGMRADTLTAKGILEATPALAWVAILADGQPHDVAVNAAHGGEALPTMTMMAMAQQADAGFQAIRSPGGVLIGMRWNASLTVSSWLPDYAAYGCGAMGWQVASQGRHCEG